MLSLARTAIPELSGGSLRMRVLAARNIMSSPLPRATIGSKIDPPPISALPPNTASIAMAPRFTVVHVTLRFSSAKKPLSRATTRGVKLATPITATRTFAAAGFDCASAAWEDAIAAAIRLHFRIMRMAGIDQSPVASNSAAAFMMPSDQPGFHSQEDAVQSVAEDRQGKNPGIHLRDLERALRQQREIAEVVVRHEPLTENGEDQRDREADAHAGEDLRARGR